MFCSRELLDFLPFFVSPEKFPCMVHGLLIGPRQQVHEFGALAHPCLPRGYDLKAMGPHDPRRVITESVMKRCLVMFENLVNPELMNHPQHPSDMITFLGKDKEAFRSLL